MSAGNIKRLDTKLGLQAHSDYYRRPGLLIRTGISKRMNEREDEEGLVACMWMDCCLMHEQEIKSINSHHAGKYVITFYRMMSGVVKNGTGSTDQLGLNIFHSWLVFNLVCGLKGMASGSKERH